MKGEGLIEDKEEEWFKPIFQHDFRDSRKYVGNCCQQSRKCDVLSGNGMENTVAQKLLLELVTVTGLRAPRLAPMKPLG